MEIKNWKEPFSIVEDGDNVPYAMDFMKYDTFTTDEPETEYEVHPINSKGEILYDSTVTVQRKELTPKFLKLGSC